MILSDTHRLPLPDKCIKRLKETHQNPCFHAEGNVYKHTLMVLENVLNLDSSWELTEEDREVLYWAAILHDIGKPEVTKWEEGRYHAHGHERAGIPIARSILLEQEGLSISQRKRILDLVLYHSVPLKLGLTEAKIDAYKKMAVCTDMRLMGIFAHCDLNGRISNNMERINRILSNFNEYVVEEVEASLGTYSDIQEIYRQADRGSQNNLWEASQLTDFRIVEQLLKGTALSATPETQATCIIPVGLASEGMHEYLNTQYPDAKCVSIDNNPSYILINQVQKCLISHREVIIFADFTDTGFRQEWVNSLREKHVEVKEIIFEMSLEKMLKEIRDPWQYMEINKRYNRMENPHPWEAHSIEYVQL